MYAAVIAVLVSCGEDYGTKLQYDKTEVYYTDKVTETKAKSLGDYLEETGFTEGDETKTVQITKDGDVYQLRMVVKESYLEDDEYAETVAYYAYCISKDVFDADKVEIHLCDENLKTLKVIEMDGSTDEYQVLYFDGTDIDYDNSVTKLEVETLGNYLVEGGFTDGTTKSVQFIKENGTYIFKMVVGKDSYNDAEYKEIVRGFASEMSSDIFNNEPVEIQLCDVYFVTQTSIKIN